VRIEACLTDIRLQALAFSSVREMLIPDVQRPLVGRGRTNAAPGGQDRVLFERRRSVAQGVHAGVLAALSGLVEALVVVLGHGHRLDLVVALDHGLVVALWVFQSSPLSLEWRRRTGTGRRGARSSRELGVGLQGRDARERPRSAEWASLGPARPWASRSAVARAMAAQRLWKGSKPRVSAGPRHQGDAGRFVKEAAKTMFRDQAVSRCRGLAGRFTIRFPPSSGAARQPFCSRMRPRPRPRTSPGS